MEVSMGEHFCTWAEGRVMEMGRRKVKRGGRMDEAGKYMVSDLCQVEKLVLWAKEEMVSK